MNPPASIDSLSPSWQLFKLSETGSVPLSMTLELTRRCHLHCLHCYLDETRGGPIAEQARDIKSRELSTAEWIRTFEQMAAAGTMYLVFTGGEAFLRRDILDLARAARELAFNLRIFTTAWHIDPKKAAALYDLGVDRVEISLYGRRETHNKVAASPAAFDRSLRGIRLLREAGVTVAIKAPLMTLNYIDRHWLLDFAAENGLSCGFDPTVAPPNSGGRGNAALRLSAAKLDEIFADPRISSQESAEEAFSFQSGEYADFLCSAGRNTGAMDPYGNVYPCLQWLRKAGNVRETPFADIWRASRTMQAIRAMKDAPGKRQSEGYRNNCPGMAEIETGNPLCCAPYDRTIQASIRRTHPPGKKGAR